MQAPTLDTERHIQYWKRCLKSLLPTGYTSTDSSRMTLGFFILAALDLLGAGPEILPEKDRSNIRSWILKCQHPNGGFCGSPQHRYPDGFYVDVGHGKQQMDPANLPATFFAILSLSFVGTLDQIKRLECLRWLRTLQRPDGSFGELITQEGKIEGGSDMRYCYVATAIRWILRGDQLGEDEKGEGIDVERLVNHMRSGQTYDGGISESTTHEAHAGYTYCAIASLSFLNRLPGPSSPSSQQTQNLNGASKVPLEGLTNLPATIHWLVSRQVEYSEGEETDAEDDHSLPPQDQLQPLAGIYNNSIDPPLLAGLSLHDTEFVGFNGRCNKMVDTCYAFWVGASLDIIGHGKLVNVEAIRRFLLEQTQYKIGGFGKSPGNPPDIYHSYLGLAALATMKEPGLKALDPALCISSEQKEKIEKLRNEALVSTRT